MEKKQFKKIYIEITNVCNLSCPFCLELKREKSFMRLDDFEEILKRITGYTNYIYLHVKGEPLIHPDFDNILLLCEKYRMKVNITTNATLIKENLDILMKSKAIRQINLSLHAMSVFDEAKQKLYLDEVIKLIDYVSSNNSFYLSLRFWLGNNSLQNYAKSFIEKHYNVIITNSRDKLLNNVYTSIDEEFIWPEESFDESLFVSCQGIKNHIGILVDGTVVPCCLDGNGVINLGNILTEDLSDILNKPRYLNMLKAFDTHKTEEELCKKCSYKNKFA